MSSRELAVLGGKSLFDQPVPVGQLYFPEWEKYETAMRGIFDRQYYTNQGPLVCQLETRLQEFLNVRHAICVTNATIGLMMAADALGLHDKVITPAYTFIATAQSLSWAGVEPLFCDVDPLTHQIEPESVETLLKQYAGEVSGILAVNLWGDACQQVKLEYLAKKYGVKLYFDSAHSFGCEIDENPVGAAGDLEVFSFHATKVLSAAEGGCICTNDDELAAHLRNIRSSYGAGSFRAVLRTSNGRMSEAQAAVALLSLDAFQDIVARNERIFNSYREGLEGIPGLRLITPGAVSKTNYQYVVCDVDETEFGLTRDELQHVLSAENVLARRYFYPGLHRCVPYASQFPDASDRLPVTERLCGRVLQLPIGQVIDESDSREIAMIVRAAFDNAEKIRQKLRVSV
ncbi:DegT/DnrJ/EryC1/StrS family aminotransferase [Serpens gallinarum]|uniref:Aminotransferase class I/II-fold pyridoxal phosphate-dependent enzyme n=1 Tax=Serpens gallinarum TaxID=2763075 RepID=A0ABR8TRF6_9PSED|nr:aminotransferase class I/II-fold pyridoxal phosphate-dependent enzyme [Serpens gallinarum]